MEIRWHEEGRQEADATAAFYKEKQSDLQVRFLDSLQDALGRIQRHPRIYRKVEGEIRKCRLPRFPYGVIYRLQADCIEVIAIMHLRQSPGYWKGRL